ncbi:hypothetical protein HDU76_007612, partial [Blyttiomyces sp. JEL0837]
VNADKEVAKELYFRLSQQRVHNDASNHNVSVFLDQECLVEGVPWEESFQNALFTSKVIILIVSEAAVLRTQSADKVPDNMLLEIEGALQLRKEGTAIVVPIWLGSIDPTDHTTCRKFNFGKVGASVYPDQPHIHKSSQCWDRTVKDTMAELYGLQGIQCFPDNLHTIIHQLLSKLDNYNNIKTPHSHQVVEHLPPVLNQPTAPLPTLQLTKSNIEKHYQLNTSLKLGIPSYLVKDRYTHAMVVDKVPNRAIVQMN